MYTALKDISPIDFVASAFTSLDTHTLIKYTLCHATSDCGKLITRILVRKDVKEPLSVETISNECY